jgi:hypothetical protein
MRKWENDVIIYNILRINIHEPCISDKQDQRIFCRESDILKMVIIIIMIKRRSCLVSNYVSFTKDLVRIQIASSLFLSLLTGGG